MHIPAVYIMCNKRNGTLYTGVTSNLPKIVWKHKNNVVPGFTQKHQLHNLVWTRYIKIFNPLLKRKKKLRLDQEKINWLS